jgi:hypothetical protein
MEIWKLERFKNCLNLMLNNVDDAIKKKATDIPREDMEETHFMDLKICAKIKGENRKTHKVELNYGSRVKKNEKCNCKYYNSYNKPCEHIVRLANLAQTRIDEELDKKEKEKREIINEQLGRNEPQSNIQTNSRANNNFGRSYINLQQDDEDDEEEHGFTERRFDRSNLDNSHQIKDYDDLRKKYLESKKEVNVSSNINNNIQVNPFLPNHVQQVHINLPNQNLYPRETLIQSNPFLKNNNNSLNISSQVNYNYNPYNPSYNPFLPNMGIEGPRVNNYSHLNQGIVHPNPNLVNFNGSRLNNIPAERNNLNNNYNQYPNSLQISQNVSNNNIEPNKKNFSGKEQDEYLKIIAIDKYKKSKYYKARRNN